MRRTNQYHLVMIIAISLVVCPSVGHADLVIDEFDEITTGDWPLVSTEWAPFWSVPRSTDLGLDSVLGGNREAWVVLSSEPANPGVDAVVADLDTDSGFLGFAGPDGARSSIGIEYSTMAGLPPDGVPDGYLAGYEGLRVDFASMSMPADGDWQATMFVGVDRFILSASWRDEGTLESLYMPFDAIPDFRLGFVGAEEFRFVTFGFNVAAGTTYDLDRMVAVVPEPATLSLVFTGAVLSLVLFRATGSNWSIRGSR